MANIILIHPKTGMDIKGISINLPLALLFISSNLVKTGHRVQIIDQRLEESWPDKLKVALLKQPICVGISAITGGQIEWGLKASKLVKDVSPNTPVAWGGIHPSLMPEQTVSHSLVDIVVSGYGEETFPSLIEALARGGSPNGIAGVYYKRDGEIFGNPPAPNIPSKNYELPYHLIDITQYFCNLYRSTNSLDVLASRGCPHQCIFCYNPKYNAGRYQFFEPEWIVSNIEYVKRHGAKTISLISDNFFSNKTKVIEFCELLARKNVKINLSANCRVDYIANFGKEFLRYLRETGFMEIFVGIESGSNRVLKLIRKDTTTEQAHLGNRMLLEAGITPIYSFMAGFPGETFDDIALTLKLMQKLKRENPEAYLTAVKIATPFPGTQLYDICLKKGFTPPATLEGWSNFYYNKANFRWGTVKEMAKLERISYITYFLDQGSMRKHFGKNIFLKLLIILYSKTVEWRLKLGLHSFAPEHYLLRKLYRSLARMRFALLFQRPTN